MAPGFIVERVALDICSSTVEVCHFLIPSSKQPLAASCFIIKEDLTGHLCEVTSNFDIPNYSQMQ